MIHKLRGLVAVCVLSVALVGCGGGGEQGSADPETLRVGVVPNQNPEKVEAEYKPFGDYLSEQFVQWFL